MKLINKAQTLLNDLLDTVLRRQWHVRCYWCRWEAHNLNHERFALARGKAHAKNVHQYPYPRIDVCTPDRVYTTWHTRA